MPEIASAKMKESALMREVTLDKVLFDPDGALMDVRAGDTPDEATNGLLLFEPARRK